MSDKRKRRIYWTPLILLSFLVAVFATVGVYLEQQQDANRLSKARVVSQQLSNNLEVFSADRERALVDLMLTWPDYDPNIMDWFNSSAVAIKHILPGIDDIVWANEQQIIQWNIKALDRDELLYKPLSDLGNLQVYNWSENFSHTLIEKRPGRYYIVLARAITPDELSYGYVAASFDVTATLSVLIGELTGPQFSFQIADGEQVLMESGEFVYDGTIVDKNIRFAQRNWILKLQSRPGAVNLGWLIFVTGSLMSLMVSYLLFRQLRSAVKLSLSQARYKAASESSLDAILIFKPEQSQHSEHDFLLVESNEVAKKLFHHPDFAATEGSLSAQVRLLEQGALLPHCIEVAETGEPYEAYVAVNNPRINARQIKVQVVKAGSGIAITLRDVTARFEAQSKLKESEEKFRRLVDGLNGHFIYSQNAHGKTEFISHSVTDILGYDPEYFRDHHHDCTLKRPENFDEIKRKLRRGLRPAPYRVEFADSAGERKTIEFSDSPVIDDEGVFIGVEGIGRDVTEDIQLQKRVAYQANHDQLTGLYNRYAFDRMLNVSLERVRNNTESAVLCFIDMDKFKLVNDTSGHPAGDELLRQVADLLKRNLDQRDMLARVGGDEFCVVFIDKPIDLVVQRLEKLLQEIGEFRFVWQDRLFFIGASIGVVGVKPEVSSASDLIKAADSACYRAKSLGSNRLYVYQDDENVLEMKDSERESVNQIQHALKHNHFELFFQPILPLNSNAVGMHYEVLLRMHDESGEYVSPGIFIPVAERYGLMGKIDAWVFENTISLLEGSPEHIDNLAKCAINLSGLSLNDDKLLESMEKRLTGSVIPPEKLCFEITETAAVTNLASANKFISTLRGLGCKFALDDFGAGMSSFTYLKNMQVDYVKIDGSFVRTMCQDKSDYAAVKAIHEIASSMGKLTIAEFVADQDIRDALQKLGVNYGQGFSLGKPMPLAPMLEAKESGTKVHYL